MIATHNVTILITETHSHHHREKKNWMRKCNAIDAAVSHVYILKQLILRSVRISLHFNCRWMRKIHLCTMRCAIFKVLLIECSSFSSGGSKTAMKRYISHHWAIKYIKIRDDHAWCRVSTVETDWMLRAFKSFLKIKFNPEN